MLIKERLFYNLIASICILVLNDNFEMVTIRVVNSGLNTQFSVQYELENSYRQSNYDRIFWYSFLPDMGGFRKKFWGGEPSIVGIKVAQLNVLLELQLRTSLVVSQIPV